MILPRIARADIKLHADEQEQGELLAKALEALEVGITITGTEWAAMCDGERALWSAAAQIKAETDASRLATTILRAVSGDGEVWQMGAPEAYAGMVEEDTREAGVQAAMAGAAQAWRARRGA